MDREVSGQVGQWTWRSVAREVSGQVGQWTGRSVDR